MKKKFIEALRRYLAPLSKEEREEILRFYEERFHTGTMYEGKSEQDIIDELEHPREIARNVLMEYGYTTRHLSEDAKSKEYTKRKQPRYDEAEDSLGTVHVKRQDRDRGINVWSLIGVILFDLFFVAWFVPMMVGLLFGMSTGFLGLLYGFLTQAELIRGSSMALNFIFYAGLMILWLGFILWIYDVIVGFISWLVRWHFDVLRVNGKNVVRFINGFKFNRFLRKRPSLRRLKSTMMTVAVVFVIVGGATLLIRTGSLAITTDAYELTEARYEETGNGGVWRIESDLGVGGVRVLRHASDSIVVVSNEREDVPVEVTIDTDNNLVRVESELQRRITINFIFSFLQEQPEVTIYLPEALEVDVLDLTTLNGTIAVHNVDALQAELETTNGSIRLYDMTYGSHTSLKTLNGNIRLDRAVLNAGASVTTTNGNIVIVNSEVIGSVVLRSTNGSHTVASTNGEKLDSSSTNGSIEVKDVNFEDYVMRTTNGSVRLEGLSEASNTGSTLLAQTTNGSLRLEDVYVRDVRLTTTNGGIRYHNADETFRADRLRVTSDRGTVDVSVREN